MFDWGTVAGIGEKGRNSRSRLVENRLIAGWSQYTRSGTAQSNELERDARDAKDEKSGGEESSESRLSSAYLECLLRLQLLLELRMQLRGLFTSGPACQS